MGRASLFGIIFVLTLLLLTPQAYGASTQGLYWGLQSGDRLECKTLTNWSLPYPFTALNERFYAVVDSLPPIPDRLTQGQSPPSPSFAFYWANGSEVGPLGVSPSLMPSLYARLPQLMFPIGNWSLMTSLFQSLGLTDLVENESVWVEREGSEDPYINCTENLTATYLKSDGALYQYLFTISNTTTREVVYHFEVIRLAEEAGLLVPLSVMVIGGTLILIVDIALLIKMRRY